MKLFLFCLSLSVIFSGGIARASGEGVGNIVPQASQENHEGVGNVGREGVGNVIKKEGVGNVKKKEGVGNVKKKEGVGNVSSSKEGVGNVDNKDNPRNGGDIVKTPPLSQSMIIDSIDYLKISLNYVFKYLQTNWGAADICAYTGCIGEQQKVKDQLQKSLYAKLFLGKKTVFEVLNEIKFAPKFDGPCMDQGKPHAGGAYTEKPNEICMSVPEIDKDVNWNNYADYTLGLGGHEISHRLGATEDEANILGRAISLKKRPNNIYYNTNWATNIARMEKNAIRNVDEALKITDHSAEGLICAYLAGTLGEFNNIGHYLFEELDNYGMLVFTEAEQRRTFRSDEYGIFAAEGFCAPAGSKEMKEYSLLFKDGRLDLRKSSLTSLYPSKEDRNPIKGQYRDEIFSQISRGDFDSLQRNLIQVRADLLNSLTYFQREAKRMEDAQSEALKTSGAHFAEYLKYARPAPSDLEKLYIVKSIDGQDILNREAIDRIFMFATAATQAPKKMCSGQLDLCKLWAKNFKDRSFATLTEPLSIYNNLRIDDALEGLAILGSVDGLKDNGVYRNLVIALTQAHEEYIARIPNKPKLTEFQSGRVQIAGNSDNPQLQKIGEALIKRSAFITYVKVIGLEKVDPIMAKSQKWLHGSPEDVYWLGFIEAKGFDYTTYTCYTHFEDSGFQLLGCRIWINNNFGDTMFQKNTKEVIRVQY